MSTRITSRDWFGIRFCGTTKGSQQLRQVYLAAIKGHEYAIHDRKDYEDHLLDQNRRHYLITQPAKEEMQLLKVKAGFDFSLLQSLKLERGCLLWGPRSFTRYHVTKRGLYVLDIDADRSPRQIAWRAFWEEGEVNYERFHPYWEHVQRTVQAVAFLHLSEPEFIDMPPMETKNLSYRLLHKGNTDNETSVPITRVGKGWNQFLVDSVTGKVRGHVRMARVGKGWQQFRLVPVSPHERSRKIEKVVDSVEQLLS